MFDDLEKSKYLVDAHGNIITKDAKNKTIMVAGVYCNSTLHGNSIDKWRKFYAPNFDRYSHRFCGFLLSYLNERD